MQRCTCGYFKRSAGQWVTLNAWMTKTASTGTALHAPRVAMKMNADVAQTAHGLKVCQHCAACGLVLLVPNPFAVD